jgi:hypothetical protein
MGEALDSHPASERGGRSRARGKWWRTGVAAKRMDARLQPVFHVECFRGAPDAIMKACAQGMDGWMPGCRPWIAIARSQGHDQEGSRQRYMPWAPP